MFKLDYSAESEYETFSGDEITIPKGYTSILEALTSVLPHGMIQLGKKVVKIEWLNHDNYGDQSCNTRNKPVKLHFSDGSFMEANHVIITVSLGVLKGGVNEEEFEGGLLFSPQLPSQKKEAIMRLGFGVVNKLFLQLSTIEDQKGVYVDYHEIPSMKMVFHRSNSEFRDRKISWWMRRTASLYPIYNSSSVIRGWFAGQEALELESLDDEAIIEGVSITLSKFLSKSNQRFELVNEDSESKELKIEFKNVVRSKWGSDPLFLGSYSFVKVGSSGEDFDTLAQPLPRIEDCGSVNGCPSLQILFAGEATHRTNYSTTHGAYFSGLREANRLLQHYQLKHVTNI